MSTPLISVILPIYKVEAYLDRCVNSLLAQSYSNLEIILVDDGSPDRCPQMCDDWAEKDPRIRVVHKKNGGLSDARNAGLAVATGELVSFIDSDDWVEPNMFELLYGRLDADGSDISACGVEMFWEDNTLPPAPLTQAGIHVLTTEAAMESLIRETLLKHPVWYKLYKKDLIQDLPFPVGKYHEDVFWSYLAISRAKKISVFDTPCYHYAQRSGSIMGEGYSLRRLDALEAKEQMLEYMEVHFPKLAPLAQRNLLYACLFSMQMSLKHLSGPDRESAVRKISAYFHSHTTPPPNGLGAKEMLWLRLGRISLKGTAYLRNSLKIGL